MNDYDEIFLSGQLAQLRENAELIKSRDYLFVHVAKLECENAELRGSLKELVSIIKLSIGPLSPKEYMDWEHAEALAAKGGKG
jgi:hypothetical protein